MLLNKTDNNTATIQAMVLESLKKTLREEKSIQQQTITNAQHKIERGRPSPKKMGLVPIAYQHQY